MNTICKAIESVTGNLICDLANLGEDLSILGL
jgi:hypothetical protein